jgi:hypothetical protein
MKKPITYIYAGLNFAAGILAVLVMIMIFMQRSEISMLRQKLSQCSVIKADCMDQLGVFYVDPEKHLAIRRAKRGK